MTAAPFLFTANLLGVSVLVPWLAGVATGAVVGCVALAVVLAETAARRYDTRSRPAHASMLRLSIPVLISLGVLVASPATRAFFVPPASRLALVTAVLLHVVAWSRPPVPLALPRTMPRAGGLLLLGFALASLGLVLWAPKTSSNADAVVATLSAALLVAWLASGPLPRALRIRRTPRGSLKVARILAWLLTGLLGGLAWWTLQVRGDAWRPPPRTPQPGDASPAASTASPSSMRRMPSSNSDSVLAWMRRAVGTKDASSENSPSSRRTMA